MSQVPAPQDESSTPLITVDVWTDVVCPWCYIGESRLHDAIEVAQRILSELSRAFALGGQELFATVSLAAKTLAASRDAQKAISAASSLAMLAPLADARAQHDGLVFPGFISTTGLPQLRRLPVYLAGVTHRVGKLAENLGRDRVWMGEVAAATEKFIAAGGTIPLAPDAAPHLVRARWLIEELRLSLFAQHLGTAEAVSLQRIQKILTTR